MTERIRPPMASHSLDLPAICDICGKGRSTRRHATCSRIRQQRESNKWAAYMANVEAKKRLMTRGSSNTTGTAQ
ncbi:hypothetical protein [Pseudomonas monteilii]|uniref:hypothetical protein n=1 Tax=Pseudomonas monteilii TaxID=76759 RepID=UPI001E62CE31|nr:hypothetical protein [Pseudomonas monteilii]